MAHFLTPQTIDYLMLLLYKIHSKTPFTKLLIKLTVKTQLQGALIHV